MTVQNNGPLNFEFVVTQDTLPVQEQGQPIDPQINVTQDQPQNEPLTDPQSDPLQGHNDFILYGKMQTLLERARRDNPNAGELRVEVEPEMVGEDMVLGIDRDPDDSKKAWYKGNVVIRILDGDKRELSRAEHTVYTPDRVSENEYDDHKAQGCARDTLLMVCNAHEYAINKVPNPDQATRDKITKLEKQLLTGVVPVDYLPSFNAGEKLVRNAIVIATPPTEANPEGTKTTIDLPKTIYERVTNQGRQIWSPVREGDRTLSSDRISASEYKPRVILQKDKASVELLYANKQTIAQKLREDKTRLPKFLEAMSRENKWRDNEFKNIKVRLLTNDRPHVNYEKYLKHKNAEAQALIEGTLENQIAKATTESQQAEQQLVDLRQQSSKLTELITELSQQNDIEQFNPSEAQLNYIKSLFPNPIYRWDRTKVALEQKKSTIEPLILQAEEKMAKANKELSEKMKRLSEEMRPIEKDIEMYRQMDIDLRDKKETLEALLSEREGESLGLNEAEKESIQREKANIESKLQEIVDLKHALQPESVEEEVFE